MKIQKKSFAKVIAAIAAMGLVFNFTACSNNSPMSSSEENFFSKDKMHVIEFRDAITSLDKGTVSQRVTPEDGGHLVLFNYPAFRDSDETGEINFAAIDLADDDSLEIVGFGKYSGVFVRLDVLPYSVKDTTKLSLTLDNNSIDIQFGPHGTMFQNPAILNIVAVGLKLENVNTQTLGVYCDNPETGQWEKVETEQVVVSERWDFVQIRNAKIPHFSRYALAWSN